MYSTKFREVQSQIVSPRDHSINFNRVQDVSICRSSSAVIQKTVKACLIKISWREIAYCGDIMKASIYKRGKEKIKESE